MPQMTIHQALDVAMKQHMAGQLNEAEALYRQILTHDPREPDCLHLLGVLCGQRGQVEAGLALVRQAITLRPAEAGYYCNQGKFLNDLGRYDEAIGSALSRKQQLDEAIASFHLAMVCKTANN